MSDSVCCDGCDGKGVVAAPARDERLAVKKCQHCFGTGRITLTKEGK